jgi:gamma-glutamylcyclotransferase (GGCT)/AIG2-like uncharacterized protein YtfP
VNTLFVYGLLKPGLRLHHIARPFVERLEAASVTGRLYDDGVPAARFDERGEIEGVILWLDPSRVDEALRILDELEDEGVEYRRIVVEARTAAGSVSAFAYEYLRPLDDDAYVGTDWPPR